MSTTAPAPALDLDAPRPVAPQYGLLSVPGVLAAEERGRWLAGVNTYGYPNADSWTWDPCSTGTFRVKSAESEVGTERFDSFGIGMSFACSAHGLPRDYVDRLRAAFDAKLSFMVERAVSQGSEVDSNGFLGDANVTLPAGGAAVTPAVGLAWLENAIGLTGLRGIIHAPSPVVSAWGYDDLRVAGDHLETANGTYVAAGGGYIGATATGGSAPASGQSWVFATTGLEVRMTETMILDEDIANSLDRSVNDVEIRAERYALATWDPDVLQAAVLIDWTPA